MTIRKNRIILASILAGAYLSIYVYDILGCIFEEYSIQLFGFTAFAAILILLVGFVVIFKKIV